MPPAFGPWLKSKRCQTLSIRAGLVAVIVLVLCTLVLRLPRQINPFDKEGAIETYDFVPTPEEVKCSHDQVDSDPIPNVIHFIWIQAKKDMDFTAYLAIRSAKISLQPTKIKLHTVGLNREAEWFRRVEKDVEVVPHDLQSELGNRIGKGWQVAHMTDVLRLDILAREGGIYMDLDVVSLRPFTQLLRSRRDVVLGHEGGNRWGMCNGIIIARKGARFISRWINSYATFEKSRWNYHSVLLPKQMADQNPEEVCPLEPTVLFWPTWTTNDVRYMHELLDDQETAEVQGSLEKNQGGLYKNQLAYHLWSQVSRSYLQRLSPEYVHGTNTRFNLMVRRFV